MTEQACVKNSALLARSGIELDAIGAQHSSASAGVFSLRRAHYFNATRLGGLLSDEPQTIMPMPGDADAKQKMIIEHRYLVVEISKRYINRGITFFDLVKQGESGLFHALDKFELEGGFRFATYASWCIRQAIERALLDLKNHQYSQAVPSPEKAIPSRHHRGVPIRVAQSHHQGI